MPASLLRRSRLRHGFFALAGGSALIAGYLIYCIVTLPHNGGLVVEPTPSALVVESD